MYVERIARPSRNGWPARDLPLELESVLGRSVEVVLSVRWRPPSRGGVRWCRGGLTGHETVNGRSAVLHKSGRSQGAGVVVMMWVLSLPSPRDVRGPIPCRAYQRPLPRGPNDAASIVSLSATSCRTAAEVLVGFRHVCARYLSIRLVPQGRCLRSTQHRATAGF
jgi:hypothetical protein